MDFFAKSKHLSTWQPHLGHLLCRFRLVTWLLQFLHMNDIACSPFLNAFSNGCGCFISLYHNFVNISSVSQVRICPRTRKARKASTKFIRRTRFSAEKPRRLKSPAGAFPRAAFRVLPSISQNKRPPCGGLLFWQG